MDIIKYDRFTSHKSCPECSSSFLVYDERRAEVYCSRCGLVVKNQEIPTLQDLEYAYGMGQFEFEKQRKLFIHSSRRIWKNWIKVEK